MQNSRNNDEDTNGIGNNAGDFEPERSGHLSSSRGLFWDLGPGLYTFSQLADRIGGGSNFSFGNTAGLDNRAGVEAGLTGSAHGRGDAPAIDSEVRRRGTRLPNSPMRAWLSDEAEPTAQQEELERPEDTTQILAAAIRLSSSGRRALDIPRHRSRGSLVSEREVPRHVVRTATAQRPPPPRVTAATAQRNRARRSLRRRLRQRIMRISLGSIEPAPLHMDDSNDAEDNDVAPPVLVPRRGNSVSDLSQCSSSGEEDGQQPDDIGEWRWPG